jgi:cytochrome d ubiquinol oxidase subunit I
MSTIRATRPKRADRAGRRGHRARASAPLFWAFRIMVGSASLHRGDGLFLLSRLVQRGRCSSRAGRSGPRSRSSRRRGSPPSWAGSWPSSAASPGRWTACCRRRSRPAHLSVADLLITLAGFVTFYSVLFVVEMGLMVKYIRKGPFQDVEETEAWQANVTNTGCAPMTARGRCHRPRPPLRSKTHDPL